MLYFFIQQGNKIIWYLPFFSTLPSNEIKLLICRWMCVCVFLLLPIVWLLKNFYTKTRTWMNSNELVWVSCNISCNADFIKKTEIKRKKTSDCDRTGSNLLFKVTRNLLNREISNQAEHQHQILNMIKTKIPVCI